MKIRLLGHVATFAVAVTFGLLMLASPAKATPVTSSSPVCSFCSHAMGQTFSVAPSSGPFTKMIDSRFRFDGDFVGSTGNTSDDSPAPEPGTILLLATGLAGVALLVRKTA